MNTLKGLSRELGIADKVHFLGTRYDIPCLLNDADIFIHMPEWEEGFGLTILEAMAAATVCIVSNNGALPEIITDGENGFLVEKGNIEQLAEKIKLVFELLDTAEMQMIRKNAQKRAEELSIERYASQFDEIILNLNTNKIAKKR